MAIGQSCANLTSSLTTVCSGVVDYEYYLPPTVDAGALNTMASDQLASASLILPQACLVGLKKLTCANVYKKCVPGVDFSNTATWNDWTYENITGVSSTKLPFMPPCQSLCTNAQLSCEDIPEVMAGGVDTFNCTNSKTNYAGLSVGAYAGMRM